ncbi:MAG: hypothetical protein HON23_07575 [Rickettsiales bacterium]|jgi:2-keto-4-pentenoate hydratase|nr:hypothetical protein [Rickettsiales bacterium]
MQELATRSFEEKVDFYNHLYLGKNTQIVAKDFYPNNLEEAYKIQAYILKKSDYDYQNFKLGGTNLATQKKFNVTDSYFGKIANKHCHQIQKQHQVIDLKSGDEELSAELEIIIELSRDISLSEKVGSQKISELISSYTIGLEFPTNYIANLEAVGVNGLVAENCAAGYLICGELLSYKSNIFNLGDKFAIYQEDVLLSQGLYGNIIGGIEGTLIDFIRIAQLQNIALRKGSLIATGGITECIKILSGKTIRLVSKVYEKSFKVI